MADLFTHASIAVLARLTQSRPTWVATFVAGTCLPDIARVPTMVLTRARWSFPAIPEPLCYVWAPMHLPVGIGLVSFVVSLLFREAERRTAFRHLLGGGLLHLLVDLFQSHFGIRVRWWTRFLLLHLFVCRWCWNQCAIWASSVHDC